MKQTTMKKLAAVTCGALIAGCLTAALSGCVSKVMDPGPMKEVVGTYRLTTYDVTPDATPETADLTVLERKVDYLKEYSIDAYLVITGNATGYYYYKDKNTDWWAESISITYEYSVTNDGEPTDRVQCVAFDTELGGNSYTPGQGRENAGFVKRTHTLNYTQHSFSGKYIKIKDTTHVVYSRVSKDTTPAYAEKKIGKSLPVTKYELKRLKGLLSYQFVAPVQQISDDLNPFIYCFIEFDNRTLSTKVTYALKADYLEGKRGDALKKTQTYQATYTENGSNVILDLKFADNDSDPTFLLGKGTALSTASGVKQYCKYNDSTYKYEKVSEGTENAIEFNDGISWYGFQDSIETYIQSEIEAYEGYLASLQD